jgi:hypothetical protein
MELPHVTGPRYNEAGNKIADGLLHWAGIYYPQRFLRTSSANGDIQRYYNRGQFIDAACNLLGQGQTLHPDTIVKAKQEGWTGFLDAYRTFLDKEQFLLADCAVRVVNRIERYQGTYDQRGMLKGEPFMLDLKTGNAPSWTGLQLAFYLLALGDTVYRDTARAALELHADSSYALIFYTGFKDFDKARLLSRAYWTAQEYL